MKAKRVMLGAVGGLMLILGPRIAVATALVEWSGDWRARYEVFDHTQWGQGPQDNNGYFLERALLGARVTAGPAWAGFGQLQSSLAQGRNGGPRATDEDQLDVHQVYVDVNFARAGDVGVTLRVGRQELSFGSSRLVSVRDAPNVRLAFDGVRVMWKPGREVAVDFFATRPVETNRGTFDDSTDRTQAFWGAYLVVPIRGWAGFKLDAYYLGLERETARFAAGVAREERHSWGARVSGQRGPWDVNFEAVGQGGHFGDGRIAAWTVAADTGFTFHHAPGRLRLGLKADIASGDRDPADERMGTFNALYPRGAYFGESGLVGPANLRDVHPSLTAKLSPKVTLVGGVDFLWRDRVRDGVYGPAVNLLRAPGASRARFVGAQPSIALDWQMTPAWTHALWVSRFYAGEFLRTTGPSEDVTYVSVTTRVRF